MLQEEAPDHHDADLVLKIYDLRREAVMRESRSAINTKYWPRTEGEALLESYRARIKRILERPAGQER